MANPQDPNNPLFANKAPVMEPTSALTFNDLIMEVSYKIGCPYYGADGEGPPQAPIDNHDLVLCQRIVNKAVRKFIADGPKPNGWRWTNPIAQIDLYPQISYDPNFPPSTYVSLTQNPNVNGTVYAGCTLLTLTTPNAPPMTGDIDTSYVPRLLQSMELRQIFLNGNPPQNTPGFFLPIDEDFTGPQIGVPQTILFWISDTQVVIDGVGGSAPITMIALTSNIVTVTAINNFLPGQSITVGGLLSGNASMNGVFIVLTASATQFTYVLTHANIVSNSPVGAGSWPTKCPFSFAQLGDYTLPANFGGEFTGGITYVANTNRGMVLHWTTEFSIRSRRQNYNVESGTPYEAAVRLMPTPSYTPLTNTSGLMLPRRRWELMTWRISSEFLSVIFPYTLAFNSMINSTDVPPSPFSHDEALKACCLAIAEKEVEDSMTGPDWAYYHQVALPQSYSIDARSAPKALGYFGNPNATSANMAQAFQEWRQNWYQRPVVPDLPGPT